MITRQLVTSLNTARIKMRNSHPRIYNDLTCLFNYLKNQVTQEEKQINQNLLDFIKESNKIEGITEYSQDQQYQAYWDFLELRSITKADILNLASILHTTSIDSHRSKPKLRSKPGMDVRVGSHSPMPGGIEVEMELDILLHLINTTTFDQSDVHWSHQLYEFLHPLTDGNGRTGRAIWAWMMIRCGRQVPSSFLHQWYYQSLDNWRKD